MPHNTIKIAFAKEAPLHRNCSWQLLLFQMHIPKAKLGIQKMMIEVTHFHHLRETFKCISTPQELQTMIQEPRDLLRFKSGRCSRPLGQLSADACRRTECSARSSSTCRHAPSPPAPTMCMPSHDLHRTSPPAHAISVCIFSSHPRLPPHIVVF